MAIGRTKEIVLSYAVLPTAVVRISDVSLFDGNIVQVLRHWPNGCNALVDVAVGYESESIMPSSGYVALNDTTIITTGLKEPIQKNNEIWAELANRDSVNTHTITVTVTVTEEI